MVHSKVKIEKRKNCQKTFNCHQKCRLEAAKPTLFWTLDRNNASDKTFKIFPKNVAGTVNHLVRVERSCDK